MKKILLLSFLFTTISMSIAQDIAGTLSIEDYRTIAIINTQYSQSMTLMTIERQPVNGSWSQLNPLGVGAPLCSNSAAGNDCYIRQSGLEIYFSDILGEFKMGSLTLNGSNFAFKIKGHLIKVGDDISKLAAVHTDAYSKRQKVRSRTIDDHQVLLHLEYTDVSISFRYDPQTNCITQIRVHQSLV